MIVMAPKDENELCRMMVTALNHDGPVAFRYPRDKGTGVKIEDKIIPVPIGKGEVLEKGDDVLILAIGRSVNDALDARKTIEKDNISATVVNCRFVKPLDIDLICSLVKKIPRVITVEDHVRQGGFGSAVLEGLSDACMGDYKIERLGIRDTFVEHGAQDILRAKYGIDADAIVTAAKKMCT